MDEIIARAQSMLKGHTTHALIPTVRAGWHSGLTVLPTVVTAALPKCPICLMGLLSSVGLGSTIKASWLLPLTFSFLLTSIFILVVKARRRRSFGFVVLGMVAAALIVGGKFYVNSQLVTYSGVGLLFAASFWSSRPKKKIALACAC